MLQKGEHLFKEKKHAVWPDLIYKKDRGHNMHFGPNMGLTCTGFET